MRVSVHGLIVPYTKSLSGNISCMMLVSHTELLGFQNSTKNSNTHGPDLTVECFLFQNDQLKLLVTDMAPLDLDRARAGDRRIDPQIIRSDSANCKLVHQDCRNLNSFARKHHISPLHLPHV